METPDPLHIFISHATIDGSLFKLREIKNSLEELSEIGKVEYWEEDAIGNIQEFMSENIEKCDLFILLCSVNATNSRPVINEWTAANQKEKEIVPIFIDESDIPAILSPLRGVRFERNNYKHSIEELTKLIKKKIERKVFKKKEKQLSTENLREDMYLKSMIKYRGVPLLKKQLNVITLIESALGREIQFSANEGRVTDLNLSLKELTSLPKELRPQLEILSLSNLRQKLKSKYVESQILMVIDRLGVNFRVNFNEYEIIPKEKVKREVFCRYLYLAPKQDKNVLTVFWNIPSAAEFGDVIEFDIEEIDMDFYANYSLDNYCYNLKILKRALPSKKDWKFFKYNKKMLILKRADLTSIEDISSVPNIYHGGSAKSSGLFQWSYANTTDLQPVLYGQFWVDNEDSAKTFAKFNKGKLYKLTNSNLMYLLDKNIIEIFKFFNPWMDNIYDKDVGRFAYKIIDPNLEYVILPRNFEAYELYLNADNLERERLGYFLDALS